MPRTTYLDKFKSIAPFVSFSYSPRYLTSKRVTRKQKIKITKYYKEIAALKSRPNQVYRSKSKDRLYRAQEYAGHVKPLPELRVAFIPTGGQKVKVNFKGGKIYVSERHVISSEILFDKKELLKNAEKHVKQKIKGTKAKGFNIMAGRYEIPEGHDRRSLPQAVARLAERYGATHVLRGGVKKKNNHYFGNWLLGVRAHQFKKQASFNKYIFAKKKAIDEAKRQRGLTKKKKGGRK